MSFELFSFFGDEAAEFGVVGVGHVGKARAEAVVVGTDERVGALQIDVIAKGDERALGIAEIDAAGGVGEDDGFDAHAREDADGERDLLGGVAFVEMDAALHARDGDVPDFTDDELARVADGCGLREVWDLFVGEFCWRREFVGEGT